MTDKKHVLWAQWTKDGKIVETIRDSTDRESTAETVWNRFKRALKMHIE